MMLGNLPPIPCHYAGYLSGKWATFYMLKFYKGQHSEDEARTVEMIDFLTIGAALGLSAGLAPGPLLTLVISETLQHGVKSGVKVALAPVIMLAVMVGYAVWWLVLFVLSLFLPAIKPPENQAPGK